MKRGILLAFIIILAGLNGIISQEINLTNEENNLASISSGEIIIKNFIPKQFKIGDVQFNIQVLNNANYTLNNIISLVSGEGYSTYDVTPIESLESREKDYIFVNGNFRKAGNITLIIRINGDVFYQNVSVVSNEDMDEKQKAEEQRKAILLNLSASLQELEQKYNLLEDEISSKSEDNYDVSKINLDDLRRIIRDARLDILMENIGGAKINLNLAQQEYSDQKNNLSRAKKIPFIQRTKDFAIIFSAIAGALIMFFTLSELLRRQGENVFSTMGRIVRLKKDGKKRKR